MKVVLVDTGPLVAFLNRRERDHGWAVEALAGLQPPLLTCEAVVAEATYLVRDLRNGPGTVLELVRRGVVRPTFRLEEELAAVEALMERYASVPMQLADACLVRMSELHSDSVLLTLDTEFRDIYRRRGRQVIPTLLPESARRRRR